MQFVGQITHLILIEILSPISETAGSKRSKIFTCLQVIHDHRFVLRHKRYRSLLSGLVTNTEVIPPLLQTAGSNWWVVGFDFLCFRTPSSQRADCPSVWFPVFYFSDWCFLTYFSNIKKRYFSWNHQDPVPNTRTAYPRV